MPLASIHLFSLSDPRDLPHLLNHIKSYNVNPLTLAKPIRWIVRPEHINANALLETRWHLLLILENTSSSHDLLTSLLSVTSTLTCKQPFRVTRHFTLSTGIPSRLIRSFNTTTNPSLLHPSSKDIPRLTGALDKPVTRSSSQTLALSPDLQSWIGNDIERLPVSGAVSMLNLLSFKLDQKQEYLKYGKAFAETIGAKRGGVAKLVGNIVVSSGAGAEKGKEVEGQWHEFALAHYPSLLHFADMLASEDYQSVNEKYRVPSLWDTCILCTSELEVEKILGSNEGNVGAKL